jgi:hypothetical protein
MMRERRNGVQILPLVVEDSVELEVRVGVGCRV